jgi:cytochrome P450
MLLPAFAPKAMAEWEPATRALCRELLDALASREVVDAAVDYAQHIPVGVIARMLGLPEDGDLFRGFVHQVVEAVSLPSEERSVRFEPIKAYIDAAIEDHLTSPVTTSSAISSRRTSTARGFATAFGNHRAPPGRWHRHHVERNRRQHLALRSRRRRPPPPRRRTGADAVAMEEMLRACPSPWPGSWPETEMHGCPMKPGDWVLLPFPAGNRDPAQFPDADQVVIDRAVNPHAASGLGIHRCIGSNLARMELRVAVEVVRAFPDFELADRA